jgi:hypothetical protein
MFHGAIPKTNIQIHISYKIGMHVRVTYFVNWRKVL